MRLHPVMAVPAWLAISSAIASDLPSASRQDFPFIIVATADEQITNRQRWPVSIAVTSGNLLEHQYRDTRLWNWSP